MLQVRRRDGAATMAVSRDALERRQVWCYLGAGVAGLGLGLLAPAAGDVFEALVWPIIALLLFATFSQVPLAAVPAALGDGRFLGTALVGNFAVMPLVAWGLVQLTPTDGAVRLGLLLVLLVPCTDWFVTFAQLGGGDPARAMALTPLNLVIQLVLLPAYLWVMTDAGAAAALTPRNVWPAFVVVLVPLGATVWLEHWVGDRPARGRVRRRLGWWPVPLLAIVILLVTAAQADTVRDSAHLLPVVVAVSAAFLTGGLIVTALLGAAAGLVTAERRTLAFTLGTRNSFIVLPFALSLPAGWELAAIVIVLQSLVELVGMIAYVWLVPRVLFRDRPPPQR